MASPARTAGAFALSLLLPVLTLVTTDRVTIPLPEQLSSSLVPAEVARLQAYLRVRTDHGRPAYAAATAFLNATVAALLPAASFSAHEFVPGKPILLASLPPADPALPALLLNSHTDVVPAEPPAWLSPPFDARLVYARSQWRIYARGAQDMKSVGLQYIEALAALWRTGWRPARPVHVSFVPDEEIGGVDGMARFIRSPLFRSLNVAVAMDEGLPHPGDRYNVYYGERQTWWLSVSVAGTPAHGATFPETSAGQVLHHIIDRALQFRRRQFHKFNASDGDLGDAIGVNLVYLKAGNPDENVPTGYVMNMLPSAAEAGFDIRVPPLVDPDEVEKAIESWLTCSNGKRCPGVSHRFVMQVKNPAVTARDVKVNPYYAAFEKGMESAGILDKLVHGIFPAATDGRYLREVGVPCFGFSPITSTPDLLHKHNEFITVDGYMKGCKIYEELIKNLAGPLPEDADEKPSKPLETPSTSSESPEKEEL